MENRTVKLMTVGDGGVGKTSLLISYVLNKFPEDYIPNIFDTYSVSVCLNGDFHLLSLIDTAGQADYDYFRSEMYREADIFLICFAINSQNSFSNAISTWIPKIKQREKIHGRGSTKYILVGLQNDRRDSSEAADNFVSEIDARKAAKQSGALGYFECSALNQTGIKTIFDTATNQVIRHRNLKQVPPVHYLKRRRVSHQWFQKLFSCSR